MRNKKALIWSLLIGIVVASIILITVIIPLLASAYRIVVPRPDYSTTEGFARLWDAMKEYDSWAQPGSPVYIPVDIKSGLKITTSVSDDYCPDKCICLCKSDAVSTKGCARRMYQKKCIRGGIDSSFTEMIGAPGVVFAQVSKDSTGKVIIRGDFKGVCKSSIFSQCAAMDLCFYEFSKFGALVDLTVDDLPPCNGCSDVLAVGKGSIDEFNSLSGGFHAENVLCERYSYYKTVKEKLVIGGPDVIETSFKVPLDISYSIPEKVDINNVKQQCQDDPCKIKQRPGINNCVWKDDTANNVGTCETVYT